MHKYFKPLLIASAAGVLSTLAIATTLTFANGSSTPVAAPASHESAPLNHGRGYTGTHSSTSLNHSGSYTSTHGSAPLNHSGGYTGTHGEKMNGQHAQNGHAGRGGWITSTVTISSVQADSPAAKAGLQAGDVISQVNGATLSNPAALKSTLAGLKPSDKVTLNLLRNGQAQTIQVTLGESPDKKGLPYLGVTFGHGIKHAPKTTPAKANTVG